MPKLDPKLGIILLGLVFLYYYHDSLTNVSWQIVVYVLIIMFFGYSAFQVFKNNKANFSLDNFSKSFQTMGILALGLSVLIALASQFL